MGDAGTASVGIDELDEITAAIRSVFESVAEHGAVVPALWRLEIANSLTVAARRGRIDTEFRRAALSVRPKTS